MYEGKALCVAISSCLHGVFLFSPKPARGGLTPLCRPRGDIHSHASERDNMDKLIYSKTYPKDSWKDMLSVGPPELPDISFEEFSWEAEE